MLGEDRTTRPKHVRRGLKRIKKMAFWYQMPLSFFKKKSLQYAVMIALEEMKKTKENGHLRLANLGNAIKWPKDA